MKQKANKTKTKSKNQKLKLETEVHFLINQKSMIFAGKTVILIRNGKKQTQTNTKQTQNKHKPINNKRSTTPRPIQQTHRLKLKQTKKTQELKNK